ncbi:MAG: hypothetical protein WKH64_17480 [Chloroflexia bacterium]
MLHGTLRRLSALVLTLALLLPATALQPAYAATGPAVAGLTLINTDTNQPISSFTPLTNGAVLNLATLPTRKLNIGANTNPATVGSVRFGLDSASNYRTENAAPYAMAGDSAGDFNVWTPTVGAHSLTATAYTGANAGGTAGTPVKVSFTVIDQVAPPPTVTSLTLINADTDQPISEFSPLTTGVVLNLATLPTRRLAFVPTRIPRPSAACDSDSTASRTSELRAARRTHPRQQRRRLQLLDADARRSHHTATAYSSANAGGTAGPAFKVSFTVTDQATSAAAAE